MPLLLDTYNLLHVPMPEALAGLNEWGLCRTLSRGGLARKFRGATLFCDGGLKPGAPEQSPFPEIEIVYTGHDKSADDAIVDAVERSTAPRRIVVVSDDRQIARNVRRRKATVWNCRTFIDRLAHSLRHPEAAGAGSDAPVDRSTPLSDEETQRWLREFGLDGDRPLREDRPWWDF